jgi:hypothetical protein
MGSIFVAVPTGHNAGTLLNTDVWTTLQASIRSRPVVLFSPLVRDHDFITEFQRPGVSFELLHPYQPTAMERLADSLASEQFLLSSGLTAVRLQRDRARLLRGSGPAGATLALKTLLASLPISRRAWLALGQCAWPRRPYARAFAKYTPDLLVTCSAGFALAEIPLILEAKRRGVPQMAIDLGWDTLISKYHVVLPVDRLAVWNEELREAAVRYHGYAATQVEVCGAPQFDRYFLRRDLPTREEFFRSIGVDPARRLVTLATTAAGTYGYGAEVIRRLVEAIREQRFGAPTALLVRVHPRDRTEAYEQFRGTPGVIIDKRFRAMSVPDGTWEFDALYPTREEQGHLAATLAYSDVLVNYASTTTIEACIFDTPVVNIAFDGADELPLPLSIRRYLHFEHYRPVVETQAAKMANSLDELVTYIAAYLERPWEDRAGRRALVQRLCGFTEGNSGERVARTVLRCLEGVQARQSAPVA